METKGIGSWSTVEWLINALLVTAVLLILTNVVWGLDTQDITIEWTTEGKRIAMDWVKTWVGEGRHHRSRQPYRELKAQEIRNESTSTLQRAYGFAPHAAALLSVSPDRHVSKLRFQFHHTSASL